MNPICLSAKAFLFLCAFSLPALHAEDPGYSLELQVNRRTIQVNQNTQVALTIRGLSLARLAEGASSEPLIADQIDFPDAFTTNIGYEPKSPGLKKVGPFELDFDGRHLVSNSTVIEVTTAWSRTEERYAFEVFPRQIVQGTPIRVVLRQQYSEKPFYKHDWDGPGLKNPPYWDSRGGSGWNVAGKSYHLDEWWHEIPTPIPGKRIITRADVPPLPPTITFDPIEVDVVPPPTSGRNSPAPVSTWVGTEDRAVLVLKTYSPTVQVGDAIDLRLFIEGSRLVNLGAQALPAPPQPYEWSENVDFYRAFLCQPKTAGLKKFGPFRLSFQGRELVSNTVEVEVTEAWPEADERYEFHVFPRKVFLGDSVPVIFRQQYSSKPFFEIAWQNPRNPQPGVWQPDGERKWKLGGKVYQFASAHVDFPTTKIGKMTITRSDLPPMPPSLVFAPIEIEVVPNIP